jgi:hypothetical protein
MAILPVQCGTELGNSASGNYGLLSDAVHFRPVLMGLAGNILSPTKPDNFHLLWTYHRKRNADRFYDAAHLQGPTASVLQIVQN